MSAPEPTGSTPGEVITFYSYKGGTGRSMALANVACLLARQQTDGRVLMIDWDLEAPGLHRYFPDALRPAGASAAPPGEQTRTKGLIELCEELQRGIGSGALDVGADVDALAEAMAGLIDLDDFTVETGHPNLEFMPAGRFDGGYAGKVNAFDWVSLFTSAPLLFTALARFLTRSYRFVLIDSRTGVTDSSGVCTTLMPEKLVVVFTPNRQSLTGVLDLVADSTRYRRESDDLRPLLVYPLPSRIEASEPRRREQWRFGDDESGIEGYQPLFETAFAETYGIERCDLGVYFDDVQLQHMPPYAYGEEIAVTAERRRDALSLSRTYERFTEILVHGRSPWSTVEAPTVTQVAEATGEARRLREALGAQQAASQGALKRSRRRTLLIAWLLIILLTPVVLLVGLNLVTSARQVDEISAAIMEDGAANLERTFERLDALDPGVRASVLDEVREPLTAAVTDASGRLFEPGADRLDYVGAQQLLSRAEGYLPDSASLDRLAADARAARDELVARFSRELDAAIESGNLLGTFGGRTVGSLIEGLATLDPQALEPDASGKPGRRVAVESLFQEQAGAAVGRGDSKTAQQLVETGLALFPSNVELRRLETIAKNGCRHPAHGIERYLDSRENTASSGWVGGGRDPNWWCEQAISRRGNKQAGQRITILDKGEIHRRTGLLRERAEYNYTCRWREESNPVYRLAVSGHCE